MSSWPMESVGQLITLDYGKGLPAAKRDPNGLYPAYGANGVKARTNFSLGHGDSLIIGRKGSAGSIERVSGDWWPLDVTYFVTLRSQDLDIDYLHLALRQLNLPTLARGVKPGINRNDVYQLQIPVPSLADQKRIISRNREIHDQVGSLTSNINHQIEDAESLRSAALTERLTGNYVRKLLETVARIDYGTRVTRKNNSGSTYPVYGGGGATFLIDDWNREDCLIISRFAMSEECVRRVRGRFFLNDSGLTVATRDESALSQKFLDLLLLSQSRAIYALGRGTAQRNLNVDAFRELLVPVPPLEVQNRIVTEMAEFDVGLAELESKLAAQKAELAAFQSAALSEALAGGS